MSISAKPLVFISCGQYTQEEKALGSAVRKFFLEETPYEPYFAEYQSTLSDLSTHVLSAIDRASALVAIAHHRGAVSRPNGETVRASVWIEQELAIAAFLQIVLGRRIEIALYLQRGLGLEGLREKLLLGPIEFDTADDVLVDLRQRVAGWNLLTTDRSSLLQLEFADAKTELPASRSYFASTEVWQLPELPKSERSPFDLRSPMENENYNEDMVAYLADVAGLAPVPFVLQSFERSTLEGARAELFVPLNDDGYSFCDESGYPQEPQRWRRLNLAPVLAREHSVQVRRVRDFWRIDVTFGRVQPKSSRVILGLYVWAAATTSVTLRATLYADNLEDPIEVPLELHVLATPRKVSLFELMKMLGMIGEDEAES